MLEVILHSKQPVLVMNAQAPAKQQFSNGVTVTPSGLLPRTGIRKLVFLKLSRLLLQAETPENLF